jgi:hypothetical protein
MADESLSRRLFAAHLVGGAAAMTSSVAAADDKPFSDADLGSAKPLELLLALVKQADPDRLKSEHLEQLRLDLQLNLLRSAVLSSFPLTNADEPAPIFAAWRSEG